MKLELRKYYHEDGNYRIDLIMISQSKTESHMIDLTFGSTVRDDGFISQSIADARLEDGYGEHYLWVKGNQVYQPADTPKVVAHDLKTLPEYFKQVESGIKKFECRKDDRNYKVGDVLNLKEYDPDNGYTGAGVQRTVTYILRDFDGLAPGWVIMGLKP